jgi:REP element-mobilizing transposase RayT
MRRYATTDALYFLTLTVVDWIDVFTRREYKDFIVENFDYCRKEKGLEIFAYVIMTNHIHLVARTKEDGNMGNVMRDFKTYTSKQLYKMIAANLHESRREWIVGLFNKHGKENPLNKEFQLWQNGNHPVELFSNAVIDQKIDYVHNNPVRAGFVAEPHEYLYSSASPDSPLKMEWD